jgi:hypothetical protein
MLANLTGIDYFMLVFAAGCAYLAFHKDTQLRGAHSHGKGPSYSITLTGRILLFLVGVVFVLHVLRLV